MKPLAAALFPLCVLAAAQTVPPGPGNGTPFDSPSAATVIFLAGAGACSFAVVPTAASAADSQAIFERAKAATVIVLSAEGAGRPASVSTGVIVSKDGTILTAYHAVKGAQEVQVRLAGGDAFDRVELLGLDERRDVAALKIAGGALPALATGSTANLAQGDSVYAVTNAAGLTWSATEGILSAIRPASEVPGAGSGFRLMQFTASVAPGSSGGVLVDRNGALIGIIPGGKGSPAFAIPIESVAGLPQMGPRRALGSGAQLEMPAQPAADVPQSSAAIAGADPKQILKNAHTIYIDSKTAFLTVDTMGRALTQNKDWEKLGLVLVRDPRVADLLIEVDRPLFTYTHTFVISDRKTTIVLGSGKVIAFDGILASSGLAREVVKVFAAVRLPAPAEQKN
ncbi:MAG: trypsin-like peptidase domain-containing protein [Terracidiphilus sp.]